MINTLVPTGDVSTMSIYHSYSDFSLFTSELEKDNNDDVKLVTITPTDILTSTVTISTPVLPPPLHVPMTVTPVQYSSTRKHFMDEVKQNTTTGTNTSATTTSGTTTTTHATKRAVYPSSTKQEVYYYTEPAQYSFEEYISAIAPSCQYCCCSRKQQSVAVSTMVNPFLFSVTSASSSGSSSTIYVDTTIVATTSSSDGNSNGNSNSNGDTTTTTTNTTTNNNINSNNNNNNNTEESEWLNLLESLAGY